MAIKIKWKVQPPPTGRYRSFEERGWPTAEVASGEIIASIYCQDEYVPSRVKTGSHRPLTVYINDFSQNGKRMRLKETFATLDLAKAGVQEVLEKSPNLLPSGQGEK